MSTVTRYPYNTTERNTKRYIKNTKLKDDSSNRETLFTLVCSVFPRSNVFTIFLSRGTGSKSTKFFSKSSFHLPRSCLGSCHNVSIVAFLCIPGAKKEKRKVKLGPCANFIPLLLALLQAEITDFLTLSYTSTSETTPSWPEAWKTVPLSGEASPHRPLKGVSPPPSSQSTTLLQGVFRKRAAEFTVTATMSY